MRRTTLCFAVFVLLVGAIGQAQADVILSTFGPGDTFGDMGFGIGTAPVQGVYDNRGARFTIGSSNALFTSAEAALQHIGGTNAVTFGLRRDVGSVAEGFLPGELLQVFTASNIPDTPPGGVVTFNAAGSLLLMANTSYWLTSEEYSPDDTEAAWRFNDIGITGAAFRIDEMPWVATAQATPAFRINGASLAERVPQPGTLALFAFGSLGLLGYRWGRGRRTEETGGTR
jgi:hypothetical protein